MRPWTFWVPVVLSFWFAAALDSLIPQNAILGGRPEFLLIVAYFYSLNSRPSAGALCGFVAGLFAGADLTANMGAHIVSRTIAGYILSYLSKLQLEANVFISALYAFGGIFFTRMIYLMMASPSNVLNSIFSALVSAFLSALIAVPVYSLLSRSVAARES